MRGVPPEPSPFALARAGVPLLALASALPPPHASALAAGAAAALLLVLARLQRGGAPPRPGRGGAPTSPPGLGLVAPSVGFQSRPARRRDGPAPGSRP